MTMLTALNVVLTRWTGQSDLVVGTVVGHRTPVQTEALIGCFTNFLPLRTRIIGGESIAALAGQVRAAVLDAYGHQDCPFEKIVEAAAGARSVDRNPLYNVGFLLQNFPRTRVWSRGLAGDVLVPESAAAELDLRIAAGEHDGGIRIECEYRTDLFEPETIRMLVDFYVHVLRGIASDAVLGVDDVVVPEALRLRAQAARERDASVTTPGLLAGILAELETLSDEEAARQLRDGPADAAPKAMSPAGGGC
jgi:non-ribosomal peptide synthetase component F